MKWNDLVALQIAIEADTPAPLKLSSWAEGWLDVEKDLNRFGFYKVGAGALNTHPFKDAPDYVNKGVHKMLGSQARQVWVHLAFHMGHMRSRPPMVP